jgi:hypothetical protein
VEALSTLLTEAGLAVIRMEEAAPDREELWFVAEKQTAGNQA